MKKILIIPAVCAALFLASCNGGNKNNNNSSDTSANASGASAVDTTSASANVPTPPNPNQIVSSISLTGNDQMHYNDTMFTVKAGQQVTLSMQNIGNLPATAMSHDVVILKPGSDVTAFGNAVTSLGNTPGALDKLPAKLKSEIVVHTKMLASGQSDQITFTLPKPGTYPYLCSFPAHFLTMHGQIVAK